MFADGLSAESLAAFHEIAKAQWQALLAASVPALQALVDADAAAGRTADRRVRIGLYTYHDATAAAPESVSRAPRTARTARGRSPQKDR